MKNYTNLSIPLHSGVHLNSVANNLPDKQINEKMQVEDVWRQEKQ